MRRTLQTLALATLLLAPCAVANAQVSIGIRIGEPPPARAYRVPRRPGPEYMWVEGYQYPQGSRYRWHDGYWTRPPYDGAYWVAPYYSEGMYYSGQWEGRRSNIAHDHKWDRGRRRDERRGPPERDDRNGRNGRDGRDGRDDGNRRR